MTTRVPIAVVLLSLSLTACSGTGPSRQERIEVVAAARSVLQQPAVAFGEALTEVELRSEQVRDRPGEVEVRALDVAVARLVEATDGLDAVEVPTRSDSGVEVQDGIEVAEAVAAAVAAARDLVSSIDQLHETIDMLLDIDGRLLAIAASWHESGSRSQQVAHFGEVADRADELATELEGVPAERPTCRAPFATRVEVAGVAGDVGRELQSLVQGRQGLAFDERREELRTDPFGFGSEVGFPPPIAAEECTELAAALDAAGPAVAALAAIQDSLNPPDLSS